MYKILGYLAVQTTSDTGQHTISVWRMTQNWRKDFFFQYSKINTMAIMALDCSPELKIACGSDGVTDLI